jgi:hypothetical protein
MTLFARFDTRLLRPPALAGATAFDPALHAWCLGPEPFAVTAVQGDPAALGALNALDALDALAAELDGSRQLARLNRWAGLGLRLRVKGQDLRAHARPGDVWDAGWLREPGAAAGFVPRRPTLILAPAGLAADELIAGLPRQARRPLRVIVLRPG